MIELKNIIKTYYIGDIEVNAVQGVSLKIEAGEFVAIMGASGSGKSTLMHLMGLLDRPDSGEYFLAGQAVHDLSDEQMALVRNHLVGFVFQQFHLLPRMTAVENASLPLIYAGKRGEEDKVRQKLTAVGLGNRMLHRPNELSGGQQQRVAIARALVNDPLVIFADEPTGNLDTKSKKDIMDLLKELHQQGKTVIMVTHEQEMADYASRVILMRDGAVVFDERTGGAPVSHAEDRKAVPDVSKLSSSSYENTKVADAARQAIFAMLSHKMRSFLSILGILIGVGAVIAMLALGRGAQVSIEKQLASLGSNLLLVRPGSSKVQGIALQSGSVTRLSPQDVIAIGQVEHVKRVSGSVVGRGQVVFGNKNWNTQIEGVETAYAPMRAAEPEIGRFFTDEEVKRRDKVVLVGTTVARELFGDVNPVGQMLKVDLINFRIIGILPMKGANSFRDQDDEVIIPLTTAMFRVLGKEYMDSVYVEVDSPDEMERVQTVLTDLLVKRHRLRGEEAKDSFQIRNMADIKAALATTTKTMSVLLGSIAAISLLVGGIGIMNIMLVSVTERTKEIGLRKAIGATRRDILMQFLVEAVLLSLIGGLAGIVLGIGVAVLITIFAGWTVKVALSSIILATLFSLTVGVIFGLGPAYKASYLNPIEALRYE
jgi:macrolide transport system ATP-binding/permease protein